MTEIDGALTTHQRLEPFLKDTARIVSQQKRNAKLMEQNFDSHRRDEIMKLKSAISDSRDDITANEGKRGERRRKQLEREKNRIKELVDSGLTERAAQIQLFREKKRRQDEKIRNLSRPKTLKPLQVRDSQSKDQASMAAEIEAPIEQLDFGSRKSKYKRVHDLILFFSWRRIIRQRSLNPFESIKYRRFLEANEELCKMGRWKNQYDEITWHA